MQMFALMINNQEHLIDDVIGFMDGVLLATECTSEATTHNAFYSGYECDTVINNVIAYRPDGKGLLRQSTVLGVGRMGHCLPSFLFYTQEDWPI